MANTYRQASQEKPFPVISRESKLHRCFDQGLIFPVNCNCSSRNSDGVEEKTIYEADEKGFRATGAHLPVAPGVFPVQRYSAFPSVYPVAPVSSYGYRYAPQNYYPYYYPSFASGKAGKPKCQAILYLILNVFSQFFQTNMVQLKITYHQCTMGDTGQEKIFQNCQ